jgi:hypothetical protein
VRFVAEMSGLEGKAGDEALANFRELYHERLASLSQTLSAAVHEMQEDDVLAALKKDPLSQQFVGERLMEMFSGVAVAEKERTIQSLAHALAQKTASLAHLREEWGMQEEEMKGKQEIYDSHVKDLHTEVADLKQTLHNAQLGTGTVSVCIGCSV